MDARLSRKSMTKLLKSPCEQSLLERGNFAKSAQGGAIDEVLRANAANSELAEEVKHIKSLKKFPAIAGCTRMSR